MLLGGFELRPTTLTVRGMVLVERGSVIYVDPLDLFRLRYRRLPFESEWTRGAAEVRREQRLRNRR